MSTQTRTSLLVVGVLALLVTGAFIIFSDLSGAGIPNSGGDTRSATEEIF